MKKLLLSLFLLFCSTTANAYTVQQISDALRSGNPQQMNHAKTYLMAVVKTLHDVDMFNQNKHRIRSVCFSDGTPITDEEALEASFWIWNNAITELQQRDNSAGSKEVIVVLIEYLNKVSACGPTV